MEGNLVRFPALLVSYEYSQQQPLLRRKREVVAASPVVLFVGMSSTLCVAVVMVSPMTSVRPLSLRQRGAERRPFSNVRGSYVILTFMRSSIPILDF